MEQSLEPLTEKIERPFTDRDKMTIITRSGRVYRLVGQPGFNADAEYVWSHWKVLNDVQEEVDVTDHYQGQLH